MTEVETKNIDLFGNPVVEKGDLKKKYGANPFTILDTKDGKWQARKRKWINLGIKSEIGRDAKAYHMGNYQEKFGQQPKTDTSVFDPVLCEIMYRWYCCDGGSILDPFAGGSVRGIVANYLGYKYTGIDIRQEQVDSDREQAMQILSVDNQPQWYCGDSNEVLDNQWNRQFDMVFTCPPYANLKVYSDLPGDISNMDYDDFLACFGSIMQKSCRLLKNGGMAIVVIGEVRDKKGNYLGLVPDTINILRKCNDMYYYNEAVLSTPIGTAMLRADNNMIRGNGKLVRVHQNIVMFKKAV